MGTPDFAVPSLEALHAAGFQITWVVTQPDRPKGRGRTLAPPPVKVAATGLGCPIVQPVAVRDADFIARLQALDPDYLVVVAFGHILSQAVLAVPKRGAVNLHASLLPKYRGPAPIQWALIRGETETGVTTMLMDSGVDTGDMLLSARTAIGPNDTAASLHQRLAHIGGTLLVETLTQFGAGTLFPRTQKHTDATYAPMLRKSDGRIRWDQTAQQIDALIRGVTPWPGAFCFRDEQRLKILGAKPLTGMDIAAAPGTVVPGFPDELRVATGDGCLGIEEIQGASGRRMAIHDFLRGHPIAMGTRLT
ncbi:MAG: methionyl-tRNA formyltransferase [Desulfatitalea sp.]|nr:methionyl-tRNA formyltransferase [Desulfatitalea sp.]